MRIRIIIYMLMMLISANGVAYSQEARRLSDSLYVLLGSQKVFEARDFYEKYKDSLQHDRSIPLIYASQMNLYLNKPDSAIKSIRRLLDEFSFPDNRVRLYYLNMLATRYVEKEDYENLIKVLDEIKELLCISEMPEEQRTALLKELQKQRESVLCFHSLPKKEVIDTSNSRYTSVPFTVNPILGCAITFNGIPLRAWIDTGCEYAIMLKKETAANYHTKEIDSIVDTIAINGVPTPVSTEIVDSIRIGTFIFKNVKALVVHQNSYSTNTDEKIKSKLDSIYALQDAIIGLPILMMVNSLEFDFEKKQIHLSLNKEIRNSPPNMLFVNKKILTSINVCGIDFVGQIDNGAIFGLNIGKSFYEKHSKKLSINSAIKEYTQTLGTFGNSKQEKIKELSFPFIYLGTQKIVIEGQDAFVTVDKDFEGFDGIIGYEILRKLYPKVKLDFQNMIISN